MDIEPVAEKKHLPVWLSLGTIVLAVVVVGGLAYMVYKQNKSTDTTDNTTVSKTHSTATPTTTARVTATPNATATALATATAGWKTYTNTKNGYSFKYPSTQQLTASSGNSDSIAISGTADGVNVFPTSGTVTDGIFYVEVPGIAFTTTGIKSLFGSTNSENMTITSTAVGTTTGYKLIIQNDNSVVSTFYFVRNTAGTVLELTVLNSSADASKILASFTVSA